MLLLDANVILRYLLDNDETMSRQAREAVEHGAYTTPEVLAEVVYVLRGVYRSEREEIRDWLTVLLDEVILENKQSILYVLKVYAETTLDFVDCLLLSYSRILGRKVFTFDKKLKRLLSIKEA